MAPAPGPPLVGTQSAYAVPFGEVPPPRTKWRGVTAVVVLLLVAVAAVAIALRSASVDDDSVAGAPPTNPGVSLLPPSWPAATPDAVAAEVERLSRFVEEQRGIEFTSPVAVEVLAPDAFAALVADLASTELDAVETEARVLDAVGLVGPGEDAVAGWLRLVTTGALGFYDPEDDRLVVAGTTLDPLMRQTLVHELSHALDDQWFDLTRLDTFPPEDERSYGLAAVTEGNATRIDEAWATTLDDVERGELERLGIERSGQVDLTGVPWAVVELMASPYIDGARLVTTIVTVEGEEGVDDALTDPPRSSSEVLWPERYIAGAAITPVPPPPADDPATVFTAGAFGELRLRLTLWGAVGGTEATAAARGWRGDQFVAWTDAEGDDCVRIDTAVADSAAVDRLGQALDALVLRLPDATTERIGSDTVRLTSCSVPDPVSGPEGRA